jgi:hypothetical protein
MGRKWAASRKFKSKHFGHLENNFYESLRVKVYIIMINPDERIRRQNINRFRKLRVGEI